MIGWEMPQEMLHPGEKNDNLKFGVTQNKGGGADRCQSVVVMIATWIIGIKDWMK
jgi:hypothetical protein